MPPSEQQPDKPPSLQNESPMPDEERSRHQAKGSWIIGGAMLLFIFAVFVWAPPDLAPWKQQTLIFICAILAGLLGYFIVGDLGVSSSDFKGISLRAGGSFALIVLVFVWWSSPVSPVKPPLGPSVTPLVTPSLAPDIKAGSEFMGVWTGYNKYESGAPEKERGQQLPVTIEIPEPATKDGKIRVIAYGKNLEGIPFSNEEIYEVKSSSLIENTTKRFPAREQLRIEGNVMTGSTWHNYPDLYATINLTKKK